MTSITNALSGDLILQSDGSVPWCELLAAIMKSKDGRHFYVKILKDAELIHAPCDVEGDITVVFEKPVTPLISGTNSRSIPVFREQHGLCEFYADLLSPITAYALLRLFVGYQVLLDVSGENAQVGLDNLLDDVDVEKITIWPL